MPGFPIQLLYAPHYSATERRGLSNGPVDPRFLPLSSSEGIRTLNVHPPFRISLRSINLLIMYHCLGLLVRRLIVIGSFGTITANPHLDSARWLARVISPRVLSGGRGAHQPRPYTYAGLSAPALVLGIACTQPQGTRICTLCAAPNPCKKGTCSLQAYLLQFAGSSYGAVPGRIVLRFVTGLHSHSFLSVNF